MFVLLRILAGDVFTLFYAMVRAFTNHLFHSKTSYFNLTVFHFFFFVTHPDSIGAEQKRTYLISFKNYHSIFVSVLTSAPHEMYPAYRSMLTVPFY